MTSDDSLLPADVAGSKFPRVIPSFLTTTATATTATTTTSLDSSHSPPGKVLQRRCIYSLFIFLRFFFGVVVFVANRALAMSPKAPLPSQHPSSSSPIGIASQPRTTKKSQVNQSSSRKRTTEKN